jgi:hypothetical protein
MLKNEHPHPKFAIRSFLVRRTRNEQVQKYGIMAQTPQAVPA